MSARAGIRSSPFFVTSLLKAYTSITGKEIATNSRKPCYYPAKGLNVNRKRVGQRDGQEPWGKGTSAILGRSFADYGGTLYDNGTILRTLRSWRMEEVGCLFCGTAAEGVFREENGYLGRRCARCGLVYLSPRPTEEEMRALYEKGEAGGRSAEELIQAGAAREFAARYALRIIRKYKSGGDILEIGAGGGQFVVAAREAGFEPFAVEVNRELARHLSDDLGIETVSASAGSGGYFEGRRFDAIYHRDVLSHLHYPRETFGDFAARLRGDGVMVFETGNVADLSERWLRFVGVLSFPEHVYLFSRRNVEDLAGETGFEIVAVRYRTTVWSTLAARAGAGVGRVFGRGERKGAGASPLQGGIRGTRTKGNLSRAVKGYASYLLQYPLARGFPRSWPSRVIYVARKAREQAAGQDRRANG